jgi:hypothetical protein
MTETNIQSIKNINPSSKWSLGPPLNYMTKSNIVIDMRKEI